MTSAPVFNASVYSQIKPIHILGVLQGQLCRVCMRARTRMQMRTVNLANEVC